MKGILIPIVLIISLMGCAAALDAKNGVELRPGEAAENINTARHALRGHKSEVQKQR